MEQRKGPAVRAWGPHVPKSRILAWSYQTPPNSLLLSFQCSDSHFFPVLQTHLCICHPSTDLSIHSPVIHPPTRPSTTYLCFHPSITTHSHISSYPFILLLSVKHSFIYPSIITVYLFINSLPIQVSTIIYSSVHISICLLTHHHLYIAIHLFIHLLSICIYLAIIHPFILLLSGSFCCSTYVFFRFSYHCFIFPLFLLVLEFPQDPNGQQ